MTGGQAAQPGDGAAGAAASPRWCQARAPGVREERLGTVLPGPPGPSLETATSSPSHHHRSALTCHRTARTHCPHVERSGLRGGKAAHS